MRNLITILILFVAVGCGTNKSFTGKSVYGIYEVKIFKETATFVLLENGKVEIFNEGEEKVIGNWKIAGEEFYLEFPSLSENYENVYRIESNGDLILIASIEDGKRTDYTKEEAGETLKKIK